MPASLDRPRIARQGEVIENSANFLMIEFPALRCSDCSCAPGLIEKPQTIAFSRTGADSDGLDSSASRALLPGQAVEVSLPAGPLRRTTAVLFGCPVLFGLLFCAATQAAGFAPPIQALAALAGFGLGALVSVQLRSQLQHSVYDRLSIRSLDS